MNLPDYLPTEFTRKVITDYEILDHGIEHSQYFQGCGVSLTDFDACFTGIGNNAYEALEDALDQAAGSGWETDSVKNKMKKRPKITKKHHEEMHYFVSIRIKGS